MSTPDLFDAYQLGPHRLANRMVMAPLTRSRANSEAVPSDMIGTYYQQRSSAGLIISEATNISDEAIGYALTPGIYTQEQVAAWKRITDGVHQKGGVIYCQLWHCGRISHPDLHKGHTQPVSSSAVKPDVEAFTAEGKKPCPTPRALEKNEIPRLLKDYRHAAECAKQAGFDGVEIHSANGYLLQQFLSDQVNLRKDEYGGSIENRCRLPLAVVETVVEVWGSDRVGIRIGPVTPANDNSDSDPQDLYNYYVSQLSEMKLSYLHVIEGSTGTDRNGHSPFDYQKIKDSFRGTYMANNLYDLDLALKKREADEADLICFGRPFISNPDLVERYKTGAKLNALDEKTLYGGGAEGYIDYPFLNSK